MEAPRSSPLPATEAARRISADHALLGDYVDLVGIESLDRPYLVDGRPLGESCETLHDLVAHVLMWDEINLAVLAEARAGRLHWSLDPSWETPEAGRALNQGAVAAGRALPAELLVHRIGSTRDALVAELDGLAEAEWSAPPPVPHPAADSLAGLVEYVMTVPRASPYWHAAIHLRQLSIMT